MGTQAARLWQPVRAGGGQISTASLSNSGAAVIREKSQNQKSNEDRRFWDGLTSLRFPQEIKFEFAGKSKQSNNQKIKTGGRDGKRW